MSIDRYRQLKTDPALPMVGGDPDGPWVRYSDHVAAVEALRESAEVYRNEAYQVGLDDGKAFAARPRCAWGECEGATVERDRIRQAARALATERELNSPSEIPVDLWEILSIIDGGE